MGNPPQQNQPVPVRCGPLTGEIPFGCSDLQDEKSSVLSEDPDSFEA